MGKYYRLIAAAVIFTLAGPSLAGEQDSLVAADATLRALAADGISRAERNSAARPAAVPGVSDHCLARLESGEEGAPKYWFEVDCKDGAPKSVGGSRWCWNPSASRHAQCIAALADDLKRGMLDKGYAELGNFRPRGSGGFYYIFRKSGGVSSSSGGLCLAITTDVKVWERAPKISYALDCQDQSSMTLYDLDTGYDTGGISRHMKEKGYAPVESFGFSGSARSSNKYFRVLVFQRP